MEREFDAVVLGAGPAGEVVAGRLGEAGLEVALVESQLVGGECSYYACMPSKALLRPAELAAEVARVPGLTVTELDPAVVLERRDEVIHELDDASQLPWLEERGITLVRGFGRLDGERRVRVGDDLLTARKAVIVATGSGAAMPPIPGLEEARPWTNREATTASAVPASLVILGGGVVGVELGQAWASLGSRVTLIEGLPRLIAREEEFASEQVEEALRVGGVDVRTGAKAVSVARDGEVTVELEDGTEASGTELLVAVGRTPLTLDIGLETIGLEPGASVEVGGDLRSSAHGWLYAIGDVNGRSLLTHMGKYQARLAADAILGKQVELRSDGALSPRVIFTEPQVAAVGYTLAGAKEAGLNVRAVDVGTSENAGGSFVGRNAPGTARLVVDEDRGVVVGATFTGPTVAPSLHAATIAVIGEVPLATLWHAVPAFPTRSELWLRLLETYGL
ncbi:MAG: NAD(P)/FAD-dependent oxidoreductase [Gaiellaceae bacterium MAG52_C11]|nr:NAD(P)/FAD-dependent oxidoreductase [Candidatus Gaiellasilicea maunaloa]